MIDPISAEDIKSAFEESRLQVFDNSDELMAFLKSQDWSDKNLLMMSSGTFNSMDFDDIAKSIG